MAKSQYLPIDATACLRFGKRRLRGFTLIELLVVVAIISLLVAILLPSLSKAQELARKAVCSVQLKSIGQTHNLYMNEYDGWIVQGQKLVGGNDYLYMWCENFSDTYDLDTHIYRCPADKFDREQAYAPSGINERFLAARTYTFNGVINGNVYTNFDCGNPLGMIDGYGSPCDSNIIAKPEETIVNSEYMIPYGIIGWNTCFEWVLISSEYQAGYPHSSDVNHLYADWHVGSMEVDSMSPTDFITKHVMIR